MLGYVAEFGDSSGFDPFDYEDVAGVVEAGAVGADESAGGKGSGGLIPNCAPILSGIFGFAQGCYDFVLAVENDHLT